MIVAQWGLKICMCKDELLKGLIVLKIAALLRLNVSHRWAQMQGSKDGLKRSYLAPMKICWAHRG